MVPERFKSVLAELEPLTERFRSAGKWLYLVGGSVRDLLTNTPRESSDFDATTDALPDEIKRCLDGWADAIWTQGERFGTIGARKGGRLYEITTHRAEVYTGDSRKPEVSFAGSSGSIETDLSRRDFTVNAMALELTSGTPTLVDPFGGAADLATGTLRTPLSPEISFSDDPLRMLRAARFLAGHQLQPVPELVEAVHMMHSRLEIVSAERIRDELDKLIIVEHPAAGLSFLVDTGLADEFLPELPGMRLEQDPIHRHKDVLAHTLAVVENVTRDLAADFDFRRTRLAALLHDVGKPRTRGYVKGKGVTFHHHEVVGARMARARLQALRYSNDDVDAITELVALHLRFHGYEAGWTDSAVRRYVVDAGPYLAELNVLTRCDCTTRNERKAAMLSRRMDELEQRITELQAKEELGAIRPEMDGSEVMAHLGLAPGPAVGKAMRFLLGVRMEEGLLGAPTIRKRLDQWWAQETPGGVIERQRPLRAERTDRKDA
ncbi:MAG: CCA tRNA nucleotidyltransferase [Ilumatobacteraceae bacterium]